MSYLIAFRVDPVQTAKLGWVRGETYFDTYMPAMPKAVRLNDEVPVYLILPCYLGRPWRSWI